MIPYSKKAFSGKYLVAAVVIAGLALSSCSTATAIVEATPTSPQQPTRTMTPAPTATATKTAAEIRIEELKYPEFSKDYQPEYVDHHEVVVEGITMNIDWGLSHWVMTRPDYPIAEIHIAPDIAPILGEIYLKSCWYRFTHFMPNNENVTYEEYVELVKQGKGDVSFAGYDEVNGGVRPVEMMINPAEGFAVSLVDQSLPIKINDLYSMYYGSDGTGRLLVARKLSSTKVKYYYSFTSEMSIDDLEAWLFSDIYVDVFGSLTSTENKCLESENVQGTCGYPSMPEEWGVWEEEMRREGILLHEGKRGPMFEVVEK